METKNQPYIFPHQFQSWGAKTKLLHSALSSTSLQEAIQHLNLIKNAHPNYEPKWTPHSLTYDSQKQPQTLQLLQAIISKALLVQKLFPNPIHISKPLPTQGPQKSWIILTRLQCCCLVACIFLCLVELQEDNDNLPRMINFANLSRKNNQITKTLLLYFRKMLEHEKENKQFLSQSHIVYLRVSDQKTLEDFKDSKQPLCEVRFHSEGTIEDELEAIQVDFANESIGGFFLAHTFTQEDIIFINNPQNIPAILFHQFMKEHEAIILIGSERVATYKGYLDTYKFDREYHDKRPFIKIGLSQSVYVQNVRDHWISAIDAIPQFYGKQFTPECTLRQLNKACVGFQLHNIDGGSKSISTGNWGSGAFAGNLQYKFLLQWIAASEAGRTMDYYPFSDQRAKNIPSVIKMCKNLTAGELCSVVLKLKERFESSKMVFAGLKSYMESLKKEGEKKEEQEQIELKASETKDQNE